MADTDVVARLKLDTSSYDKTLDKAASDTKTKLTKAGEAGGNALASKLSSAAKTAGKAIAVGIAGGTAAVAGLVKTVVGAYGDFEQLTGGVETLFKDSAGIVTGYAEQAYRTAGLSANDYMEQATSFSARLIQGLGGDTAKAAEYANKAIVDMSDNANKMGTDISMIQNAYQGFAKQNYTMLDNLKLGYGGTASEMARLVNDSGVLGSAIKVTANTINSVSFDKIIEAIHKTQENLDITGTTSKEAASTVQGSVNSMKASWKNLLTEMGKSDGDMGKAIDEFIVSAETAMDNLLPVIERALEGISALITEYGPKLQPVLETLFTAITPIAVQLVGTLIGAILQSLPSILATNMPTIMAVIVGAIATFKILLLTGVGGAWAALGALIAAAVIGIVGLIMDNWETIWAFISSGFEALGTLVGKVLEQIGLFFGAVGETMKNVFQGAFDFITGLFNGIGPFFSGVFNGAVNIVKGAFSSIGSFFSGVFNNIVNLFRNVGTTIGNAVGGAFKAVVNTVIGFVEGFVNIPVNAINGLISVINAVPGVDLGYLPTMHFPRLETGGIVPGTSGGRIILAGEGGQDEWVVPESKMASLIEQINGRLDEGGQNITINLSGTFATSAEDRRRVADQIVEAINQNNQRRFI